ncbi:Tyrosine-protein kinase [Trema orientale]|uniref:Tyrosine-protein kinase n=1 Tax=Trema orientale TaxID=63057 RepID=A0A2P5EPU2_TREOI|nr:Tyrosine-protein kinase [Trema orientale]
MRVRIKMVNQIDEGAVENNEVSTVIQQIFDGLPMTSDEIFDDVSTGFRVYFDGFLVGASKRFIAECNALRNIRHRNLVKIVKCCSSIDYNVNESKALVSAYRSNGSLEKRLRPSGDRW